MLLWIVFALLTGVAVLAVLVPLTRAERLPRSREDAARAVHHDQLHEIDNDLERGVIGGAEAVAARTEIARRLLIAASAGERGSGARPMPFRAVAFLTTAAVPAASIALYLALGAPELPRESLTTQVSAPERSRDIETLIARVEQHLADNPDSGRGWEVLAPVYMQVGRTEDAARALRNVIRLSGVTPERQANLGEALVAIEGGVVMDEARELFKAAASADSGFAMPRFFLAIAAEQDGDRPVAAERWLELIKMMPEEAPWRTAVSERLELARRMVSGGLDTAEGPSADDMLAAAEMSEAERAEIKGKVASLADRLKADGNDLEGWLKLARAYVVLGDTEKARAALASARLNFAGEPVGRTRIDAAARDLGLQYRGNGPNDP